RDATVTGVQTCALPISENGNLMVMIRLGLRAKDNETALYAAIGFGDGCKFSGHDPTIVLLEAERVAHAARKPRLQAHCIYEMGRSEERRVGKEWRGWGE